ncbi:hypothetical protein Ac2012v2_003228, partial [Leucoagaricus gongylophorus]
AAINFFQHPSQMKVLPIGKGYVTLYFFAIMIHCSPPFCYESGIMQHYAYVHPI